MTKPKTYHCTLCGAIFFELKELYAHNRKEHGKLSHYNSGQRDKIEQIESYIRYLDCELKECKNLAEGNSKAIKELNELLNQKERNAARRKSSQAARKKERAEKKEVKKDVL